MIDLILEYIGLLGLLIMALGIALLAWPTIAAGAFLFAVSEAIDWYHRRRLARESARSSRTTLR